MIAAILAGETQQRIAEMFDIDQSTVRAGVWEWYTSTFLSREEANAKIVLTLTRWHMHDLAEQILDLKKSDDKLALQMTDAITRLVRLEERSYVKQAERQ